MSLLEQMNYDLGIDKQYIKNCSKRNNLYAKYSINKKSGGKRTILQPSKELKVLQYWLTNNIFSKFPISEYATAYQKGCSIKKNALYHNDSKYILHTDIVHFFENINRASIIELFKENKKIINDIGLSSDDIKLILDLVLYKGEYLVVGSVASPMISNCVMYNFDMKLADIVEKQNMKYSRYADDIIISSSNYIEVSILSIIDCLLQEYNFKRNLSKTYFMNKHKKRQVTGIVLDNNSNTLSLGHKKYAQLKRELYNYLVKGVGNIGQINGMIAYLRDINYESYIALKKTYTKYDKKKEIFKSF